MRRLLVTVAAALAGVALCATPARAHADLGSTSPAADSRVRAVSRVQLHFGESVAAKGDSIRVLDEQGHVVSRPATVDGGDVTAELTTREPGLFVVAWRVGSADGHRVSGAYRFSVDQDPQQVRRPTRSWDVGIVVGLTAAALSLLLLLRRRRWLLPVPVVTALVAGALLARPAEPAARELTAKAQAGPVGVDVSLSSDLAGPSRVTIRADRALTEATATADLPALGITGLVVPLDRPGSFPLPGDWQLHVQVRTGELDGWEGTVALPVRPSRR